MSLCIENSLDEKSIRNETEENIILILCCNAAGNNKELKELNNALIFKSVRLIYNILDYEPNQVDVVDLSCPESKGDDLLSRVTVENSFSTLSFLFG